MPIMGNKVKFYKLVPKMFKFGVIKKKLNYSDPEKTALDLFYLRHYDKGNFEEIAEELSRSKLFKYGKNYNKKVMLAIKELKWLKKE